MACGKDLTSYSSAGPLCMFHILCIFITVCLPGCLEKIVLRLNIKLVIKDNPIFRLAFVLLLILMGSFISSCDTSDRESPTLTLEAPLDNGTYEANSVVQVIGTARDNVGVSIVQAQITNILSGQVVSSANGLVEPDGSFNFDLTLGDRYSPNGDYRLTVTAYDAAENRTAEYIEVFLFEFPSEYYQTVFYTADTLGNASLYAIDTLGQIRVGPFLGQNITGFEMDNRAQHLLVGQRHGTVTAYYPSDFSVLFQLFEDGGPSNVGCTYLATYQNDFFWASAHNQYLKRYSKDGIREITYNQVSFPVYGVAVYPLWVVAGLESQNGNVIKLDRYDRSQGVLRETKLMEWRPVFFGQVTEDRIIVGGNYGPRGQLFYTLEDDFTQILDSTDVGQPVYGIESDSGHTWIWMKNRVSTFDPVYRLGQPTIPGEFTAVGWDPRRQQLWLGKHDVIEVYNANGILIQTINGNFGTVTEIDFHYNK